MASKPRNSDSRIRYASLRYSRRARSILLSVYWYGTLYYFSAFEGIFDGEDVPKHNDSTPVVMIKIDPLRDFTSGNRKQNGASTVIARLRGLSVV